MLAVNAEGQYANNTTSTATTTTDNYCAENPWDCGGTILGPTLSDFGFVPPAPSICYYCYNNQSSATSAAPQTPDYPASWTNPFTPTPTSPIATPTYPYATPTITLTPTITPTPTNTPTPTYTATPSPTSTLSAADLARETQDAQVDNAVGTGVAAAATTVELCNESSAPGTCGAAVQGVGNSLPAIRLPTINIDPDEIDNLLQVLGGL